MKPQRSARGCRTHWCTRLSWCSRRLRLPPRSGFSHASERRLQFFRPQITKISTMADTYVPLISSGVAGPLGVLHLPRLWQKVSLEENGKLATGYPGVGKGFDAKTLAALGLEEQAVRDYIKQNKPTYPQFETWVKKNAKWIN